MEDNYVYGMFIQRKTDESKTKLRQQFESFSILKLGMGVLI